MAGRLCCSYQFCHLESQSWEATKCRRPLLATGRMTPVSLPEQPPRLSVLEAEPQRPGLRRGRGGEGLVKAQGPFYSPEPEMHTATCSQSPENTNADAECAPACAQPGVSLENQEGCKKQLTGLEFVLTYINS